jgi:putative peptidoglycan lipid II flippase
MLMGPGALGLAATQVNIFVNILLAASQGTGAVSWLTYAFRLMYLPIGLFGVSIGTAVLPAVSRHAATNDTAGIRDTVSRGVAMMFLLNVPATFGLLALATPIVRLLFERGRFLPADTIQTAAALRYYAIGLVGYSTVRIVSPAFYALRKSRLPVIVSTGTIALNVALSVALVHAIGFRGLALATSIAALANGATLLWLIRRELHGIDGLSLSIAFLKTIAAAAVMTAVVAAIDNTLRNVLPGGQLAVQATRLSLTIGAGLASLAGAAKLLRIREFDDVVAMIGARVAGRSSSTADSGTEVAESDRS